MPVIVAVVRRLHTVPPLYILLPAIKITDTAKQQLMVVNVSDIPRQTATGIKIKHIEKDSIYQRCGR